MGDATTSAQHYCNSLLNIFLFRRITRDYDKARGITWMNIIRRIATQMALTIHTHTHIKRRRESERGESIRRTHGRSDGAVCGWRGNHSSQSQTAAESAQMRTRRLRTKQRMSEQAARTNKRSNTNKNGNIMAELMAERRSK